LISIINKLDPEIDVEAVLAGGASHLDGDSAVSFGNSQDLDSDVESAALSDKYEWRETSLNAPPGAQKSPLDGMASLPTGRTESGYLG
jgi:transcriptional regulatory protein GAL4